MGKNNNQNIPKKRKSKQILVFDEHLRRDYLSGFSRRKQHRKRIAREEIVSRAKEAKKIVKEKYREMIKQSVPQINSTVCDIAQESTSAVYDLPDHVVTVTNVAFVDTSGADGLSLGENQFESDEEKEEDDIDDERVDRKPVKCIMKSLRGELTQIELKKQSGKKKKRGKMKRKGPLKKGAHKRRNNLK